MTHHPCHRYSTRLLHVFLMLLVFTSLNNLLLADEQVFDCMKEYESLSAKHTAAIAREKPDTQPYFKLLHGIEDEIFPALQNCPENPLLFTLMGEVQISLGNLQLAELYARKAISQDQDIWQTNHLLGITLSMQNKYTAGITYLEKATKISNNKPALVFNLCSTSLAAKKYQQAVTHCSNLIDRNDHQLHASAYHIRSQAYKALAMDKKSKRDSKNARLLGYE